MRLLQLKRETGRVGQGRNGLYADGKVVQAFDLGCHATIEPQPSIDARKLDIISNDSFNHRSDLVRGLDYIK